jgi:hypothetical protein
MLIRFARIHAQILQNPFFFAGDSLKKTSPQTKMAPFGSWRKHWSDSQKKHAGTLHSQGKSKLHLRNLEGSADVRTLQAIF